MSGSHGNTALGPSIIGYRRTALLRASEQNEQTRIASSSQLQLQAPRPSAEAIFVHRYAAIRTALERYAQPGLAIFAFDHEQAPIGEIWLRATEDRSRAIVIGRHSRCQLMIPREQGGVSLRHLAVLVRRDRRTNICSRILDLHTGLGFQDESGRRLESVEADGPAFFGVGGVTLMGFPTRPGLRLPEDGARAWAELPPRAFIDAPEGLEPSIEPEEGERLSTSIAAELGVLSSGMGLVEAGETPKGTLLAYRHGRVIEKLAVGARALRRGILVGRYDRCALGRSGCDRVSRVHLLIVEDGKRVLAVDAASTNGSYIDGVEVRQSVMKEGCPVRLGDDLWIEWRFVN